MTKFARTPNYYPALVANISQAQFFSIQKLKDDSDGKITKLLNFYTNEVDSYFYHPYVLFSGAHHYKIKDFHKKYRIGKDTTLFVDSGGYQLATGVIKDKKYSPDLIYDWAKDMAQADILPILDHPLRPGCNFKEHLDYSSKNAEHFADRKKSDDKKGDNKLNILNVVSGDNAENIFNWYEDIRKHKLDGWAHGAHGKRMQPILTAMMHLWQNGEFNKNKTVPYHIFGTGSIDSWLYIAYTQMKFNQRGVNVQISADNSNANFASSNGMFMAPIKTHTESYVRIKLNKKDNLERKKKGIEELPDDHPEKTKKLKAVEEEIKEYAFEFKNAEKVPMFCDCVACSLCESMTDLLDNSRLYYLIITLHNIIANIRIKKQIDSLVFLGIPEVYPEMFIQTVVNRFKVIDKVFNNPKDADKIMRREWNDVKTKELKDTRENVLGDWF